MDDSSRYTVTVLSRVSMPVGGGFVTLEASVSESMPATEPAESSIDALARALNARVNALVQEQIGHWRERTFTAEAPPPPSPTSPTNQTNQSGFTYPPRAEQRQPGQSGAFRATHYRVTGTNLELYAPGRRYPIARVSLDANIVPRDWLDTIRRDGQQHEFAMPVLVSWTISDRRSPESGNHYVDVVGLQFQRDEPPPVTTGQRQSKNDWCLDPEKRRAFWAQTDSLGLSHSDVHAVLGIESLLDWESSAEQALALIRAHLSGGKYYEETDFN